MMPMNLIRTGLRLLASALFLSQLPLQAVDFHVATAQALQNALTLAAANGANNNIWLTNGYYTGNFSYNSSANYSLTVQPEAGVTNTQIAIDGAGGGGALNLNCSGSSGNVSVSGITFVRNCGSSSDSVGALRIAAPSGGTITVDGCRFLTITNNTSGVGLVIASGQNAIIRNCLVLGKTNNGTSDGDGIYISGVTGNTWLYNSTMAGSYGGWGANIGASAILTVTNNVFQTNSSGGLSFSPSGNESAVAVVSNNVFSGSSGNNCGAYINNFGTLNVGANVFCDNNGGGLYVSSGVTATIAGNTFYGNDLGGCCWGGVHVTGLTTAIVTGNTISGNAGGGSGYGSSGAFFVSNTTNILTGNTFSGNSTYGNTWGGAAYFNFGNSGVCTISNNIFNGNSCTCVGGAVALNGSGTVFMTGNTFTGNSTSGNNQGGAVYFTGGTNIIIGNTFQQNSSAYGGGAIYGTAPVITISDNLVVNNSQSSASMSGGGIFVNASATLYMVNNTIFGNTSGGNGGGVSFQVSGTVELLNVYNNIIWGNTASGSGTDVYLTGVGQSKLFMYNDANGMSGVWNNATPQLNADPKFVNAVSGDYHLQTNSPCLNYGTNGTFLPLTDLDGNPRTNSLGQVDLGCYEFNNTATHPADTNGTWVITAGEYNAYAAAWKAGQTWTNAPASAPNPNPIPANYVTRAGYLMTNGGSYYNDGSARPTNWRLVGH